MLAAYQNAVREQKLAAEISAAKRERDFYMSRVDRAKGAEAKAKRQKVRNSFGHMARDGQEVMNRSKALQFRAMLIMHLGSFASCWCKYACNLQRKAQEGSEEDGAGAATSVQPAAQTHRVLRTYGQKRPKLDPTDDKDAPMLPQDVLSLLGGKK